MCVCTWRGSICVAQSNRSPARYNFLTFCQARTARCLGALKCRPMRAIGCLHSGHGNGRSGKLLSQFDDPGCLNVLRQAKQAKWTRFLAVGTPGPGRFPAISRLPTELLIPQTLRSAQRASLSLPRRACKLREPATHRELSRIAGGSLNRPAEPWGGGRRLAFSRGLKDPVKNSLAGLSQAPAG